MTPDAAPTKPRRRPLDAVERHDLREAMKRWEQLDEASQRPDDRPVILMKSMMEHSLVHVLATQCPDPDDGMVGLLGAALPALGLLRLSLRPMFMVINEPPQALLPEIQRLERLHFDSPFGLDVDPPEALEPYIMIVPMPLYCMACESNAAAWAFRGATKTT
jgi:hypothetical protein